MAKETESDPGSSGSGVPTILRTTIPPNPETAEYAFLEVIADLEGVEIEALPSLYEQLDHFVELLFKQPPARESQVELSFSYCGYRVRLTQDGQLTVLGVKNTLGRNQIRDDGRPGG